jgi:hypothetical protein
VVQGGDQEAHRDADRFARVVVLDAPLDAVRADFDAVVEPEDDDEVGGVLQVRLVWVRAERAA